MKIAELYVILGFHVEGAEGLQMMEKGLDSAASKAGKLVAGIDVMTAGLLYMMNTAVNAAVGMSQFSLATGLSTTELQQWQHTAAIANVSGAEIQKTIMALQEVKSRIMLGGGAAAPWLLLGLNVNQSPIEMLKQLHTALLQVNGDQLATTRILMQQAGFDDKQFAMLRRSDLPIDALTAQYILTQQNATKLVELNKAWNDLSDRAQRVKNIFSSEMAPGLTQVINLLLKGVELLASFVHWLDSGSIAADLVTMALQGFGIVLAGMGVLLTTFAVGAKALSFALGGLEIAALPIAGTMMTIAGSILAVSFAVYELIKATEAFNSLQDAKKLQESTAKDADYADKRLAQSRRDRGLTPQTPKQKHDDALLDETPFEYRGRQKREKSRSLRGLFSSGFSDIPKTDTSVPPLLGNAAPEPRDLLGHAAPSITTNNSPTTVNIDKVQIDGHQYNDAGALARGFIESLKQSLAAAGAMAPAKNQ